MVFRINPHNYTGKKLYRVTEGHDLWVTNSSSKCAPSADVAFPPDIAFLHKALMRASWDCYLVCGARAQDAFHQVLRIYPDARAVLVTAPVIFLPHPAARKLTNKLLAGVKKHLVQPGMAWVEFRQYIGSYRKVNYAGR